MATAEDLLPPEHFLRKQKAALGLKFVCKETAHVYSRRYGCPRINSVTLVKYLPADFLYDIPPERQIEQLVQIHITLAQHHQPTTAGDLTFFR
jgi:transposase